MNSINLEYPIRFQIEIHLLKNNKKAVKWSSSNNKISLSKKTKKSVKVYAKSAGTSYVTAKVGKKKYTCKVTIKSKNKGSTSNKVFNPKLSCTKKTLKVNENFTLTISGTKGRRVEWYTDYDFDYVKVSKNSNTSVTVKGVKGGRDTITAEVNGKVLKCNVSIETVNDVPVGAWTSKEGLICSKQRKSKMRSCRL